MKHPKGRLTAPKSSRFRTMAHRSACFAMAALLCVGMTPAAWGAPAEDAYGSDGSDPQTDIVAQLNANAAASIGRVIDTGDYRAFVDQSLYNDVNADAGTGADIMLQAQSLPSSYDMRDKDLVTSVKLQNPWGDCWGFAAIAASETSIISETGLKPEDVDLSELQLAWFAYQPLASGYSGTAASQAGEGLRATGSSANAGLNIGGMPFTATSILSTGAGPVPESLVPYENAQKIVEYEDGIPFCYSEDGDWSVAANKRFLSVAPLEHSSILPSPADTSNGTYTYNEAGTAAIKEEIYNGRAVEIAFHADDPEPGDDNPYVYLNTQTWAQYTYADVEADHAVTVVGWDDDYPASNFMEGHYPPGNGAWLIKNSWGANDQTFPNWNYWGIDGDGYFWLSYYDMTIELPETFDYDTSAYNGAAKEELVAQYDYLQASTVNTASTGSEVSMANVFTADCDQNVTAIATETAKPGTTVEYRLYRLKDGYTSPTDGTLLVDVGETYTYGGYHRYAFPENGYVMKEGESYSVVVTQTLDDAYLVVADYAVNQEGAEYIESQGTTMPYYGVGIVREGESFLQQNGTWTDWTEVIPSLEQDLGMGSYVDYDNFSIKAYAKAADDVDTMDFSDVAPGDWFYNAVEFVYKRGLMTGYSNSDEFGPYNPLLRQDMAVIVYRYLAPKSEQDAHPEGSYVANETGLRDVKSGEYYTAAVNWCFKNGIMTGYGDRPYFGVGTPISREEFAVVLNRMDGKPIVSDAKALLKDYPDASAVADWAENAMAWCVERKIIRGLDGRLDPTYDASRCEVAQMLWSYIELVQ